MLPFNCTPPHTHTQARNPPQRAAAPRLPLPVFALKDTYCTARIRATSAGNALNTSSSCELLICIQPSVHCGATLNCTSTTTHSLPLMPLFGFILFDSGFKRSRQRECTRCICYITGATVADGDSSVPSSCRKTQEICLKSDLTRARLQNPGARRDAGHRHHRFILEFLIQSKRFRLVEPRVTNVPQRVLIICDALIRSSSMMQPRAIEVFKRKDGDEERASPALSGCRLSSLAAVFWCLFGAAEPTEPVVLTAFRNIGCVWTCCLRHV